MSVKHSLVIPCFNEEGNVEIFLNCAKEAMKGYTDSYELIFVNDGSRDKTGEVLKRLFNENKDVKIKIINFSRNFGKEAAMYAGLNASCGEYTTIIDADMQQRPEVAVQMGRILDENPDYDMVAAFQEKRKDGKLLSKIKTSFYSVINKVSEVHFIEDASDFRTMRKNVVKSIIELTEYHRFSKGIFSWIGYNVCSIPYEVMERESGETKWSVKKLIKYALDGIMAYTDLPLKLPLYFGIGTMVLDVLLFVALMIAQFGFDANCTAGFLACLMVFLFSIISVFIGIAGTYIGKIHTQVKNRPVYIAKEILTYEENL
ncbi:MAG: glycosyltransferase family 2 protein [Ruminococcaceae bacterium]|nr:glycosyltransferase family 2 protein [Oscillospiraceae bacterium]